MALRVGDGDARAAALLAMGYPVGVVPRLELGPRPKRTLFVQGERDEFGSPEAIGRLVEQDFPNGKLVVVPGADHFFTGHVDELERAVSEWLIEEPWKGALI
jgi:alpha/beta superfamily hydrolase